MNTEAIARIREVRLPVAEMGARGGDARRLR